MTEELYIDGVKADIGETNITFAYKSNLFGELGKVTSNYSYTISLDKTPTNRYIFYNAGDPTHNSKFPRRYHSADYIRNGVPMIRGARCILVETTSDKYQIQLIFGVLQDLSEWLNEKPKLTDLQGDFKVRWDSYSTPGETIGNYGYAYYYNNQSFDNSKINIHPSVKVSWLLGLIQSQNGISISFPEETNTLIDSLYILLTTANASEVSWPSQGASGDIYLQSADGGIFAGLYSSGKSDPNNLYSSEPASFSSAEQKEVTARLHLLVPYDSDIVPTIDFIRVNKDNVGLLYSIITPHSEIVDDSYYWAFDWEEIIPFEGYTKGMFFVHDNGAALSGYKGTISFEPHFEDLTYPSDFPIIANLPPITQIDFVKAIANMVGSFALSPIGDNKALTFVSASTLVNNKANAYRWKVEDEGDEPVSVKYSLDGFSQKNILRYKEDETVGDTFGGIIYVDDKTIELESIKAELPFAGTLNSTVPLYKEQRDEETITYELQTIEPRIFRVEKVAGVQTLVFSGLSFDKLISDYYRSYQSIIRTPVVIKERIKINEVDLSTLDYTRPVYLRKYGRYFGIVSIQYGKETTADLLLLPIT